MKTNLSIKIIALCTAFTATLSFANSFNFAKIGVFDEAYIGYQLLKMPHSEQEKLISENTKQDNDLILTSLQALSLLKTAYTNSEIEDAIFYIMTTQHSELKSKWNGKVLSNGVKIFQDDAMVNYEQYSFTQSSPMVNKNRIKKGLPPVSYDSLPIEICALTKSANSSRFELLSTQVEAFITLSRSGLTKDQACVSEDDSKNYWLERQMDFVDKHLNYTPRYHYE